MISTDLEYALARLPRSSKYAREPLTLTLDFSEAKERVRYKVQLTNYPDESPLLLEDRDIALKFPSTKLKGRISEERMRTSAHEFGHAFAGVQLGARFETVVVVPTGTGAGGYVKPNGKGNSAADLLAQVYMILGSRAFERLTLSANPLDASSVLSITSGPSQDIRQATVTLYNMLYLLGMNPEGGTVDRNFNLGTGKYAQFEQMPHSLAEKLGLILRDMEDQIVRDMAEEHSRDWYVERIIKLAAAGSMNEKEFYELIDRKLPDGDRRSVGTVNEYFRSIFERALVKPTTGEKRASADRKGNSLATPKERSDATMKFFSGLLKKYLARETAPVAPLVRTCEALFVAI